MCTHSAENIRLHSRLMEKVISIEWIVENIEYFEPFVDSLSLKSSIFGPKEGGLQWQLVMDLQELPDPSTLSLHLHESSPSQCAWVHYRFGIVDATGKLQFEENGEMKVDTSQQDRQQCPTTNFRLDQIREKSFFVDDRLRVHCQISTISCQNIVVNM